MTADRKPPPIVNRWTPPARDDRDIYRARPAPRGVGLTRAPTNAGIPQEVDEVGTGVVEGDDLRRIRARRPTAQRLERLEDKHDVLAAEHADMRAAVGRIEGQLEGLGPMVASLQKSADRLADRDDLHFKATLQVDQAARLGTVEIDTAEKLGTVSARLLNKELGVKLVATGSTIAAIVLALIEARHC